MVGGLLSVSLLVVHLRPTASPSLSYCLVAFAYPPVSEISPKGGVGMPPGAPPMMGKQTGPKMMFVNLLPEKAPDKTAWSSRDVEMLSAKWRRVRTEAWVSGWKDV